MYFWSKVNIWNDNCTRATAFIFDTRTGVLVKVPKFWDRKCLDQRGTRTPKLRIHANAVTYWAIRARHLLSHVFEHWPWRYRYFLNKVNIWNVNCARATAFIFDTRTGVLVKVSKFLRQKMSRPERDSKPQSSDSCRMLIVSHETNRLSVHCLDVVMSSLKNSEFVWFIYP